MKELQQPQKAPCDALRAEPAPLRAERSQNGAYSLSDSVRLMLKKAILCVIMNAAYRLSAAAAWYKAECSTETDTALTAWKGMNET